jgi:hypothetical protein
VDPRRAYDELTALQRRSDRLVGVHEIADELVRVDPIMEVDGAVAPPQHLPDHAGHEAHAIPPSARAAAPTFVGTRPLRFVRKG